MTQKSRTFEFPRSSPAAQGVSASGIANFFAACQTQKLELHSMMLLRHGHVIAETWAAPYQASALHQLNSLTKSFASTALGLLVDRGLVSTDDLVVDFFPEKIPVNLDPKWKQMRVHHILTMNSGHDADALGRGAALSPQDWTAGIFSIPPVAEAGTLFAYNGGASFLVAAIVKKVSGKTVAECMQEHVFGPLEIPSHYWQHSPEGVHNGGYGLYLATESVLRFGSMFLNKGLWQGQRILSAAWVEAATARQVDSKMAADGTMPDWDQGYGYQFWRCRHNVYRGDGAFGQFCLVFPELDAVLVTTSGLENQKMPALLELVWEHILPAFDAQTAATEKEIDFSGVLAVAARAGENHSPAAARLAGRQWINTNKETINVGIQSASVALSETGAELRFEYMRTVYTIQAGLNQWQGSTSNFAADFATEIQSRALWTEENVLVFELRHLIFPFPCLVTLSLAADTQVPSVSISITRRGMPGRAALALQSTLQHSA